MTQNMPVFSIEDQRPVVAALVEEFQKGVDYLEAQIAEADNSQDQQDLGIIRASLVKLIEQAQNAMSIIHDELVKQFGPEAPDKLRFTNPDLKPSQLQGELSFIPVMYQQLYGSLIGSYKVIFEEVQRQTEQRYQALEEKARTLGEQRAAIDPSFPLTFYLDGISTSDPDGVAYSKNQALAHDIREDIVYLRDLLQDPDVDPDEKGDAGALLALGHEEAKFLQMAQDLNQFSDRFGHLHEQILAQGLKIISDKYKQEYMIKRLPGTSIMGHILRRFGRRDSGQKS